MILTARKIRPLRGQMFVTADGTARLAFADVDEWAGHPHPAFPKWDGTSVPFGEGAEGGGGWVWHLCSMTE